MADHDTLVALNRDYIDSVQNGDVKRFDEILAGDFHCSNPDGSIVDRAGFLKQTAQPVTIRGLKGVDVMIRMFDDVAIIHGGTTYTTADGRAGARALHRRLAEAGRQMARHLRARHARLTYRQPYCLCANQWEASHGVQSNLSLVPRAHCRRGP